MAEKKDVSMVERLAVKLDDESVGVKADWKAVDLDS